MKQFETRKLLALAPGLALLAAVVLALFLASDVSAAWSNFVKVPGSDNSAGAPDAAAAPDGTVHLAWWSGSGYKYASCNPTTNKCSNAVMLTGLGGAPTSPQFISPDPEAATAELEKPSVAVNSKGDVFVGYADPHNGATGSTARIARKLHGQSNFTLMATLGTGWQVRVAVDALDQIHADFGGSGKIHYRRFRADGTLIASASHDNFSNTNGMGSQIGTDSLGGAHIVTETTNHGEVMYVQISPDGKTAYPPKNVSKTSVQSANPDIKVSADDKLHIVWQEGSANRWINYKVCDLGLENCGGTKKIYDGGESLDPRITLIGSTPFISYEDKISSANGSTFLAKVYFGTTGKVLAVDNTPNHWFPVVVASQTGELNIAYRQAPAPMEIRFRHQPSGVGPEEPTQTPTESAPEFTVTPTDSVPPPDATVTPTAPPPPPQGTPVNVSNDAAGNDQLPALAIGANGGMVVAWQRTDKASGKTQIFANVAAPEADFAGKFNLSNSTTRDLNPSAFAAANDIHVLYQELPSGSSEFDVLDKTLVGSAWQGPTNLTGTKVTNSATGVGVKASDGKLWVAWRETTSSLINNIYVKLVAGGGMTRLSDSGSALMYPSIAAGANGQVFVAWADRGLNGVGCCIKVSRWDGSNWAGIENPTNAPSATSPALTFANGKLYAVWQDKRIIYQRVWDGSAWGATSQVQSGGAPLTPEIGVASNGDTYVVWSDNGVVYESKNSEARRPISGGKTGAKQPVLVMWNDAPYVAFSAAGEIWFVANP